MHFFLVWAYTLLVASCVVSVSISCSGCHYWPTNSAIPPPNQYSHNTSAGIPLLLVLLYDHSLRRGIIILLYTNLSLSSVWADFYNALVPLYSCFPTLIYVNSNSNYRQTTCMQAHLPSSNIRIEGTLLGALQGRSKKNKSQQVLVSNRQSAYWTISGHSTSLHTGLSLDM